MRLLLTMLVWLACSVVRAAPVWEAAQPAPEALRAAAVEVRSEAKAAEGPLALALTRRAELLDELAQAIENDRQRAAEQRAARAALEREADALAARERAATAPVQPTPEGLRSLEAEVEAARRRVEARAAERSRLEARLEALPRRIEEARQRTQVAQARALALEQSPADDETPADPSLLGLSSVQAANARLEARVAEELARTLAVEEGDRSSAELLDNQLDLAERFLRQASSELATWREATEQHLTDELTRLGQAVQAAEVTAAAATDAYSRFVGTERAGLARTELEVAELERARLELERQLSLERDRLAVERGELDGVRSAIERDPRSSHTATRLKETFQRLQRRQQGLDQDAEAPALARLGTARARRLDVGDALTVFTDRWRAGVAPLEDPKQNPAERLRKRQELDGLRDQVRGALRRQSAALTAFIAAGEALRSVQTERGEVFAELDRLVRTRIFWIQDASPLWSDLRSHLGTELARVLRWTSHLQSDAMAGALGAMARDPLELMLALVLVLGLPLGLLLARRRFARLLRRETDSLAGRLQRLGVGVVLVSLAPLSLIVAAAIVGSTGLPDDIRPLMQSLLMHLGWSLWAWSLVTLLLARDGVLVQHFGVPADPAHEGALVLRLIITGYAVCWMPERLLGGPPIRATTLAHFGIFCFGIVVLLATARLLRRRGLLMEALSGAFGDRPGQASVAPPFRALVLLAILVILGMDVLGYRYGAGRLARGLFLSVLVVVPLTLIRPRATEAWRRWRAPEDGTLAEPPRWMRPAFVTLGFLLLALVWGVDQGAVRLLDGIRLYTFDETRAITLLDVTAGLLVLAVTIWVVSVLPRVLKAIVFPYFSLDDGAQYAIASIARYVLFFIGLVAMLNTLELDLGKLSWLMAALGVGIGFGLQEIVSNFVSGVILLLERPIRVGDFVSVGPIEGRVLHINIRATTILSLDRREIILPNKDLITKEVTNWTGTDRMIRITLVVNVAFGTDVEQVTRVLLAVAAAEPVVVEDPAPEVVLMRHTLNGMEFELRVHIPDPWVRFRIIDRLNKAMMHAFATEGIRVALPQQDLHIRSGVLETRRVGPAEVGLEVAQPEKAGPEKAGPEKAGPEKAGPEKAGPEKAGPPEDA